MVNALQRSNKKENKHIMSYFFEIQCWDTSNFHDTRFTTDRLCTRAVSVLQFTKKNLILGRSQETKARNIPSLYTTSKENLS